jgi:hypothetical protein
MDLKNFSCLIKEPTFGCYLDEKHMFGWLKEIEGFSSCHGRKEGLEIEFDSPFLSRNSLQDLIGLFARYGINMHFLRNQVHEATAGWLDDPNKYWHRAVFGDLPGQYSNSVGRKSEAHSAIFSWFLPLLMV